jgi:hypothetical protein
MAIKVTKQELEKAGAESAWAFLQVFINKYLDEIGGALTAENMGKLNADQHTLLAFNTFRDEVRGGGFVQLIYNGYGGYIFGNPFAKALKLMGAVNLSKLVYKAKDIYELRKTELEKEVEEEELCEIYSEFEEFDELDEDYIRIEDDEIFKIAQYVDEHIDAFAEVV